MPVYFFDVLDGKLHKDHTGKDLDDLSHACLETRRVLSDIVLNSDDSTSAVISVRDEDNQTVLTATMSLAVHYPDTHH